MLLTLMMQLKMLGRDRHDGYIDKPEDQTHFRKKAEQLREQLAEAVAKVTGPAKADLRQAERALVAANDAEIVERVAKRVEAILADWEDDEEALMLLVQ